MSSTCGEDAGKVDNGVVNEEDGNRTVEVRTEAHERG
jgi:hypothetical protein